MRFYPFIRIKQSFAHLDLHLNVFFLDDLLIHWYEKKTKDEDRQAKSKGRNLSQQGFFRLQFLHPAIGTHGALRAKDDNT
jgi:hypothetical protein